MNTNFRSSGRSSSSSSYRPSRYSSSRSVRKPQHDFNKFIKKAKPVAQTEYTAEHKFVDFPLNPKLQENIANKGYISPTPIQDKSIMPLLEGKDIVGIANTGTGKTAAFLIPLIDKIYKNKGKQKAIIIVPTRELASQIEAEFRSFSYGMGIFSVLCIGGTSMQRQIFGFRRKFDIVIGTPGRLNDMLDRGLLKLNEFQNVVLDEVDRMLDMGFIDDIKNLMGALQEERQTFFFSATMDKEIEPLLNEFLTNPVKVSVRTAETAENVEQNVVRFKRFEEKIDLLQGLLQTSDFEKVLIFDKTKQGVEDLCMTLQSMGFKAVSIHGDKRQSHRLMALRNFKENRVNILVATDVAARGLDIDNVSHVINYDIPENYETYVHRIGRTGRGNKAGNALTFVKG